MSGPPAQGYKLSGEGHAGGGPDGSSGANTSAMSGGTSAKIDSVGPPQEIAGTLPNDFNLANTKAESKGEDREQVYSHDVDEPENKPHLQAQSNEGSKPPTNV